MAYFQQIGQIGEEIASSFLKEKGFQIIDRHVTCRWREIDIIAKKNDNQIFFIEVKKRVGDKKGKPYEAITFYKIKKLKNAIHYYLLKNDLKNYKISLGVISIILDEKLNIKDSKFFDSLII